MPLGDNFVGEENAVRAAYGRAVTRNTIDRADTFRQLGFDVKFDESGNLLNKSFTNDPFSQAGQLFQGEADASRNAQTDDFQQSGLGVGSGGLFNQARADVRRSGDLGRLNLEKDFAQTQAGFLSANREAVDTRDADIALIDIERKLSQEFDPYETPGEADNPEVSASGQGVSFKVGGKTKSFNSKKDLIKFLKGKGQSPAKWVQNHPEAARQLGFRVQGDNTAANKGNQLRAKESVPGQSATLSTSGKKLTGAQIARFKKSHPNSKRFK